MRKSIGKWMTVVAVLMFLILSGCTSQKRTALWNGKDFTGWKLFIPDKNVNIRDVWSVRDGVIHCKGRPDGYMRTQADYSNYKLHVEWRWVEEEPTNSGVLLHISGPDKVWPRCIESQLKADNAGDFVLIGGTGIGADGKFVQDTSKPYVIVRKKEKSSEKAPGEWNTYEIVCEGDTITNYVNGVLQNKGTNATETFGKIALQSEGSPIEFRNIYIEPLD